MEKLPPEQYSMATLPVAALGTPNHKQQILLRETTKTVLSEWSDIPVGIPFISLLAMVCNSAKTWSGGPISHRRKISLSTARENGLFVAIHGPCNAASNTLAVFFFGIHLTV
jgi:hypothetical protein